MAYNSDPNVQTLAEVVAMDPKAKAEAWSRYLQVSSRQHNAFAQFETDMPKIPTVNSHGKRGIFARKNDLKAIGGDTVNFTVISPPAGPGVIGEQELTGNTSKSSFTTYKVTVDWHRDAVEFTKKQLAQMATGSQVEMTTGELLKLKMGMWAQNEMMLSLVLHGVGNTYRPNNRATRDAIIATDRLDPSLCAAAKARLNTLGGRPISQKTTKNGDLLTGYLVFGTEMAMLDVRNNDGYQNAITSGHGRGAGNANFTGELVDWQGLNWFEHIVTDLDWDDYIGSPIQPKALLAVAFNVSSAIGACVLKATAATATSRYFQFFPGFDYQFYENFPAKGATYGNPDDDATVYYAWICNPDGSRAFVSHLGSGNAGTEITINGILATAAGTSTLGSKTLGDLDLGTTPTVASNVITPDGDANVPADFVYADEIQVGAIAIPANAKGVQIGHGFVFGAHAACKAYGSIEMQHVAQDRDYNFVKGGGYEMICGQAPCVNTNGVTNGYLLMEFAIEHEGYQTPFVA